MKLRSYSMILNKLLKHICPNNEVYACYGVAKKCRYSQIGLILIKEQNHL